MSCLLLTHAFAVNVNRNHDVNRALENPLLQYVTITLSKAAYSKLQAITDTLSKRTKMTYRASDLSFSLSM